MLARIPIRWRLILFHALTLLGIGALLALGMFVVFGIAVANAVEQQAEARSNEAARIVETTGTLTSQNLALLNRDNVMIVALDAEGRVIPGLEIGFGLPAGTQLPTGEWSRELVRGEGLRDEIRDELDLWDNRAVYVHAEPIGNPASPIASVVAGVSYDWVGGSRYSAFTLAFTGLGIVAFVLLTIASFFLVRYSLAPVTAIAGAAAEISERDLSRRLPVRSGRDELDRLAMGFNALLGRLEGAFHDRQRALDRQRQFTADASHELRTPLTSILGYARMLRTWGLDRPELAREAVASLEREAVRMERLVSGMLQLSRDDEGAPMHLDERELGPIVLDAIDATLAANPAGPAIAADLAVPGGTHARVDEARIRQVVSILLDNAIKFSPPHGTVRVTLRAGDDALELDIADDGPGIPPGLHDAIFERFFRAETSRTTAGSGLGLPIARAIAARHGGTLTVESRPGHGATFRLTLPRGDQSPDPPPSDAWARTHQPVSSC